MISDKNNRIVYSKIPSNWVVATIPWTGLVGQPPWNRDRQKRPTEVVSIDNHDGDDYDAARVEIPVVGRHVHNDARRAMVEGSEIVEGSCRPCWVLLDVGTGGDAKVSSPPHPHGHCCA